MSASAKPRLGLLDPVKGQGESFLRPLLPKLAERFDVVLHERAPLDAIAPALDSCDILWVDWAVEHAMRAAELNVTARKPLVLRIHSFEVFDEDWLARIEWSQVSCCVTVSRWMLAAAQARAPGMRACRLRVIPNGIDLDAFRPCTRPASAGRRIAWVGDIAFKKAPMLALQIFADYMVTDPEATLHVAGEFRSRRLQVAMLDFVERHRLQSKVIFYGQVSDMPNWLADKDVLLSTSLFESFGYAIGESLAVGLDVVVLAYPGATETWPSEIVAATPAEAVSLLRKPKPVLGRDFVAERYGLARQSDAFLAVLDECLSERGGR